VLQFHKPLLPVEHHHPHHPVVRITAADMANAMAAAMADSPPNSHQEELMSPNKTTMVACS
jgi:hypothetical protein